uniref:PSP proline-rich domain-containing protein n=2 Tax=Cuerna arida TaxID=1464854 RepID=A0A1B6EWG9_9HEMI
MELESPESPIESPESPTESPESPTESPESPKETETGEELLFIEDRRPGDVSPFKTTTSHDCNPTPVEEPENFIRLSNNEYGKISVSKVDEVDNTKTEASQARGNETTTTVNPAGDFLFVMEDRNPQLSGQETQSPRYIINENFWKSQNQKGKRNKLANTCWNCQETTHSLRDCPHPRNHSKIAKSRREFQESRPVMPVYRRYHVDEGQRLAHLVPGQMSSALRRALGLDPQELPGHIYMMRRLGYPPGWLAEACVSHSGITMFDGQGNQVAEPGSETGEILEEGSLDKYDIRKIHRYPGFNVPPPPDTYDDSKFYKVPPLSRQQSVEVMLEKLTGRIVGGYKRRKLSPTTGDSIDETSQSVDSQDMDYEETPEAAELPEDNCKFVPPLPDEEELPPPPPTELPPEPSASCSDDSQSRSQSLSVSMEESSLTELEEQKKLLLAQLNDVSPLCSTPESRIGKIKSMDFGTPILKSVSPYARLPSADKFSVNICDVINFENLPDSTGKYEKMSGIIRKVRTKLSKISSDP